MKSKVKKIGNSEDDSNKNSTLFIPSDKKATIVLRTRQAISKEISEEEEIIKLGIISLQQQIAAIL